MKAKKRIRIIAAIVCTLLVVAAVGMIMHRQNQTVTLPEIPVQEYREDELVFALSLDDYIERFNRLYSADYHKDYLLPIDQWYGEKYETGIHSPYETIWYDFSEDKTVWTLPTITAYVPPESDVMQEITVNFDDHSYREDMYGLYEELCYYTVRVFFPDLDSERATWLYQMLNNHAYQNLRPYEDGYRYGSVPDVLYYQKHVGIYAYFAEGESMHLCIIPVDETLLERLKTAGTELHSLDENMADMSFDKSSIADTDTLPPDELKRVEMLCSEIAASCEDVVKNVQHQSSAYMPDQMVITQESMDAVEKRLIECGYTVLNTDAAYPSYLADGKSVQAFWNSVQKGQDAWQDYVWVSPYGGFHLCTLEFQAGEPYFLETVCQWDGVTIDEVSKQPVLDWTLTEKGHFYYKLHDAHSPAFEDYTLLRLYEPDKELCDLSAAYIEPVGYQSNNMFSSQWSSDDYGALCFNDVLEFLYREQTGCILDPQTLTVHEQTFYYCVPADTFESVITAYFDIPPQNLKSACCYNEETDTYPWLDVAYDNLSYFPLITPDVQNYRTNSDGTITLTVDAMCVGLKTDSLFRHELTVRPDSNGSFQYVSNRIINTSTEMPAYIPRLEMQR